MIQILAIHNPSKGAYGRPSPHTSKHGRFPSPANGMDTRIPISSNDPQVCIYAYNIVPSEYGLAVRSGFREYVLGVTNGNSFGVSTIIPFEGSNEELTQDRLFAVNNEGIWDVTVTDSPPVLKAAFPSTSLKSGYGTYTHYLDDAGNDFLLYADSVNGLYEYSADTDQWTIPTEITGVEVGDINFVVVHKLRVWFGTRDSTLAYYLPINSKQGEAEPFNFGGKFKHGGNLKGLYNWTVDGGDGVDDYLVAVSRAGDVQPYQGSDPTQADWSVVGTYFVGGMAQGPRCCSQYGGNISLLSVYGITQMSDLLRGVDPRVGNEDSIGSKIAPLIRRDMVQYRDEAGWDVKYLQTEGVIIVTTPTRLNGESIQYVHNQSVGGWGIWRGVPITSLDVWNSLVYFGTQDGRIMVMDVAKDNILIDSPEDRLNGDYIEFSLLHNYLDLDDPAMQKRGCLIRPDFLAKQRPTYSAKFLYDYDINEIGSIPYEFENGDSAWDISIWDDAIWGTSTNQHYDRVIGGSGIGRYISVAIKGKGITGTLLASTDITWDTGWFL